jgi:hypothetical protein
MVVEVYAEKYGVLCGGVGQEIQVETNACKSDQSLIEMRSRLSLSCLWYGEVVSIGTVQHVPKRAWLAVTHHFVSKESRYSKISGNSRRSGDEET